MLSKVRSYLIGLIVIAIVGAAGYWNITSETASAPPSTNTRAATIDFYATKTRTQQFSDIGSLRYELTSSRLEHFQDQDLSRLQQPELNSQSDNGANWHIRSNIGEISQAGDEVELIDNVQIKRTDSKGQPLLISTSRATVFPDKEYAETQQAVRIDSSYGVTTAIGMTADMNDGKINLLSNVRGLHEAR